MGAAQPFVAMRGITKRFPGVLANDQINLTIQRGEIHALLGENGAGKSTLMNILYGLYQPDEGQILINGEPVQLNGPHEAIRRGIGMVHQHFMLVPPFTVAENIVLGSEPRKGFRLDMRKAIADVQQISEQYGLHVNPTAKVQDISVGMQQRAEILKALYRGADLLILDEPTAVLTPQEVDELIVVMRELVAQGKAIVFITHKLKEVLHACDKVTVMRRGRIIDSVPAAGASVDQLAALMVGREVKLTVDKQQAQPGTEVLRVEHLSAKNNRDLPAVRDVSFNVQSGEIVAIAGVEGNGQTELIECLTGLRKCQSGTVQLKGKSITNQSPRSIGLDGLAHIPQDRHQRGLVLDFTVAENMILQTYFGPPFAQRMMINRREMHSYAERLSKQYDVRTPAVDSLARTLSGGNQQKVVVAREIERDPDLLIAAQPTRGLDVGAIEFIHQRLVEQRDAGKAVLLVSLELDEVLALADRILVMYDGQIAGAMPASEATEEKLGILMAGGSLAKEVHS
jgi:simple sugar transport system ATP-binding protein